MILDVGTGPARAPGLRGAGRATAASEAVELFRANRGRIDAVVLDMVMPGLSGGETFDRLREIDPGVGVLLSSGYSIDSQAREILARGCDDFIQKPYDLGGLSRKLRAVIDARAGRWHGPLEQDSSCGVLLVRLIPQDSRAVHLGLFERPASQARSAAFRGAGPSAARCRCRSPAPRATGIASPVS